MFVSILYTVEGALGRGINPKLRLAVGDSPAIGF